MDTYEMASVLEEYLMLMNKVAGAVNLPDTGVQEGRGVLGGVKGFSIGYAKAHWLRRALSELVGLRVRVPYVTMRGAFMIDAVIARVSIRDDRIEVVMDNGLRYRITTTKPKVIEVVNFAMLLSDEKVRDVLTKALERVGEESARYFMVLANTIERIKDVAWKR